MEDDPNGRQPQNIKCKISQQPLVGSYPNFKLKLIGPNQSLQKFKIEDDINGRRSQNIKCRIPQQLMFGSYPNFKR
jgi:hypothetical protein